MGGQRLRVFEVGQCPRLVQERPLRAHRDQQPDAGQRGLDQGVEGHDSAEAVAEQDDRGLHGGDQLTQGSAQGAAPDEEREHVARRRMGGPGEGRTAAHRVTGTEPQHGSGGQAAHEPPAGAGRRAAEFLGDPVHGGVAGGPVGDHRGVLGEGLSDHGGDQRAGQECRQGFGVHGFGGRGEQRAAGQGGGPRAETGAQLRGGRLALRGQLRQPLPELLVGEGRPRRYLARGDARGGEGQLRLRVTVEALPGDGPVVLLALRVPFGGSGPVVRDARPARGEPGAVPLAPVERHDPHARGGLGERGRDPCVQGLGVRWSHARAVDE